jgi:hypothetical protein
MGGSDVGRLDPRLGGDISVDHCWGRHLWARCHFCIVECIASASTFKLFRCKLIVGWVPIFREVRGNSIGGDLDIDNEGSEQRQFEPVQSLHHGYVGYQPVCTWIGLTKKAMSLQANREHKQEQERTILNCRWIISSWKWGSYKLNVGETILDILI